MDTISLDQGRSRFATLKALLNKAVEWDVLVANPMAKIKPLKVDTKAARIEISQ